MKSPSQSVCSEAKNVPTTNASAERDFGMLDRLMRMKPKALDMVYEGMIMFNLNKTKEWRDSLPKEQLDDAMEKARKSKSLQKKLYLERKQAIHETRVEKLNLANQEKERKARNNALEKEKLNLEIANLGGIWVDENEVKEVISKFHSDKKKERSLENST